jgi:hypothetical protein
VPAGRHRVRTLEDARSFVLAVRVCTLFSRRPGMACLWDVVDWPDRQPGEGGWGEKVGHVWRWKNQLPEVFPDEVFYGKIRGGHAVLMDVAYLAQVHYPQAHRPVSECPHLAQRLYATVCAEPYATGALRREAVEELGCSRAAFEGALRELQVTLNIVRVNDPGLERDHWGPFSEQYPQIVAAGG